MVAYGVGGVCCVAALDDQVKRGEEITRHYYNDQGRGVEAGYDC